LDGTGRMSCGARPDNSTEFLEVQSFADVKEIENAEIALNLHGWKERSLSDR